MFAYVGEVNDLSTMESFSSGRALRLLAPSVAAGVLALTLVHHLGQWAPSPDSPIPPSQPAANPSSAPAPQDFGALLNSPLFGTPAAEDAAAKESAPVADIAVEDLPPTTLNAALAGVAYSLDQARAYAIIRTADGNQREYRVGDTVDGVATLHAINPLEVVLDNQGKFELLALPLESQDGGAGAQPFRPELPGMPQFQMPPGVSMPPTDMSQQMQPPPVEQSQ